MATRSSPPAPRRRRLVPEPPAEPAPALNVYSRLQLQEIRPVAVPPKTPRRGDDAALSPQQRRAQGREDSTATAAARHSSSTTNAALFGSNFRRETQFGFITVQRPDARRHASKGPGFLPSSSSAASTTTVTPLPLAAATGPVEFDPFLEADCYTTLIQDPATSPTILLARRDPRQLARFRRWLSEHFPGVLASFRSLGLLQPRRPRRAQRVTADDGSTADESSERPTTAEKEEEEEDEDDDDDDDDDGDAADEDGGDPCGREILGGHEHEPPPPPQNPAELQRLLRRQRRRAQRQAWARLFETVRVLAVPPGEVFVTQDQTPARDLYVILSGACELVFQPKFVDLLVQQRHEFQRSPHKKTPSPAPLTSTTTPGTSSTRSVRRDGQETQQEQQQSQQRAAATAIRHARALAIHAEERAAGLGASTGSDPRASPQSRRQSLSTLDDETAAAATLSGIFPLRVLGPGEYFGLETAAFGFPHHLVSALSLGALQRNVIGITTQACLHVLVLPLATVAEIRESIHASQAPIRTKATSSTTARTIGKGPSDASWMAPRRRGHHALATTAAAKTPTSSTSSSPSSPTPPPVPRLPGCDFRDDAVDFLRQTFIFQSCQCQRLEFLASHMQLLHVPRHEYLFTTGQDVGVFLVRSGQLRVFSPEQVKIQSTTEDEERKHVHAGGSITSGIASIDGHQQQRHLNHHAPTHPQTPPSLATPVTMITTTETRHVELEILQAHDLVGLMEAGLLQPTFRTYCLAATSDVWVYALPVFAVLTVLAHEPTAAHHVVDHLACHHSWYKARKFTALNHHNRQTEFHLSLGAQRKSPLLCSRCGWSGHTSTSSLCVRAASPKLAFLHHLTGNDGADTGGEKLSVPVGRSRSIRLSQAQLQQLVGASGSVGSEKIEGAPITAASPNRRLGSMLPMVDPSPTTGPVGGAATSPLPQFAKLQAQFSTLLRVAAAAEKESNTDETVAITGIESELARALGRLDLALNRATAISPASISPRRPQTQQQQHQRRAEPTSESRHSFYNLQDETLRAIARISTAVTSTTSPRNNLRTARGQPRVPD